MIVTKKQAAAIRAGTKTTHRRPIDPRTFATTAARRATRSGRTQISQPFLPHRHDRYPIKTSRGGDTICHVVVNAVRREVLGTITYEAVKAEGFPRIDTFMRHWVETYDRDWSQRTVATLGRVGTLPVTTETLAEELEITERGVRRRLAALETLGAVTRVDDAWTCQPDAEFVAHLGRFQAEHAHRHVWVMEISVDRRDRPRLLADRNARIDYSESPARALAEEPEAIDKKTQDGYAEEGHEAWVSREDHRQAARELLSLEDRIRSALDDGRVQGIDVHRHERAILQRLRALEAKVYRRAA